MAKSNRTLSASEFKAKCLKLMDDVARSGEAVLITKHGKVVAQLGPAPGTRAVKSAFGMHRGLIYPIGKVDVTKPVVEASEWTADTTNVRHRT